MSRIRKGAYEVRKLDAAPAKSGLLDGLVAWWDMDEPRGARRDYTQRYWLQDNNAVPSVAGGPLGDWADFTAASSQYLSISNANAGHLNPGDIDFSIIAWLSIDDLTTDRCATSLFQATGDHRAYMLRYSNSPDRFQFFVSDDGTAGGNTSISADTFGSPSGATTYFIHAYHESGTGIGISINNGTVDTAAHLTGVHYPAGADFNIGALNNGAANFMEGQIAPVGFWKRKLIPSEVTDLFAWGNAIAPPFTGTPLILA